MAIKPTPAQVAPCALATVEFHGQSLITFYRRGEPYVAMKPIAEGMGLQWHAQRKRIYRNPILAEGVVIMKLQSTESITDSVAADGKNREMIALPLKLLNGWLFGVDVSRVRPELRETVLAYQRECYDVLYRHWHPTKTRGLVRELDGSNNKPLLAQSAEVRGLPFWAGRCRILLDMESSRVVSSQVIPDGACVVDPADHDNVMTFFREHVQGETLRAVTLWAVSELAYLASEKAKA